MTVEERLLRLETVVGELDEKIEYIKGKVDTEASLIKWVIFPLMFIVAALVGIKLVLPS